MSRVMKDTISDTRQWRSLTEATGVGDEEREAFAAREFPTAWASAESGTARRDFLKIMGASMGLAGLGACVRQPEEKIVPYVKHPEQVIPGKPRYYATTASRGGYATGVIAESHLGRPTHLEGNSQHPGSQGGLDALTQASVLELWDPDRSQSVMRRGKAASWGLLSQEVLPALSSIDGRRGKGLRILTSNVGSPSLAAEVEKVLAKYPEAVWHQWEAIHRDEARQGAIQAFGRALEVRYAFTKAKVVVSLDADVTVEAPGAPSYARDLTKARRNGEAGNRIYAFESCPTGLGALSDHRFRVRASDMGATLSEIAAALGVSGVSATPSERSKAVAADLRSAGKAGVVVVGDHLPAEVHALAHAVNAAIGAVGTTVELSEPVHARSVDNRASLKALIDAMNGGQVEMLVMLDVNPLYDAPADSGFAQAFEKVAMRVHAGLWYDETARNSHWHLPMSHYLETWSDGRAFDGTVSIVQPLIAPIYPTKSGHELFALLRGELEAKGADLVQGYWSETWGDSFDGKWNRALHDGVVSGSKAASVQAKVAPAKAVPAGEQGMELVLRPCPSVWDGRHANNAWLQETPRPVSRVVWDNAVYMAPATAEKLGVKNDQVVRVSVGSSTIEGPAFVMPGHAADSVTVHLGYGRTAGGRVGEGVGFDAYPLTTGGRRVHGGASVEKTGRSFPVVTVQDHWSIEGRNHVRHGTKEELQAFKSGKGHDEHGHHGGSSDKAPFARGHKVLPINLYPDMPYSGPDAGRQWGMTIDLSTCTGCNACMVACQSENNIPVIGKEQVGKARELHWIRIDRYYEGTADEPTFMMQPTTCMHCERAPCEPVCPANATVHGPEGINQMVYNRCIGTRYCSNNCPYKVRRFNFFLYADFETESLKGQRNPDVTVRSRGVMEKCTYCVQRIKEVTIEAKVKDHDKIPDGAIRTACQAACPTEAIAFGDINDPESRVARLKNSPLNYTMLEELNTAPRTSYLAAVKNPNPKVNG